MTSTVFPQVLPSAGFDPLRLAAAAYLARFRGQSRVHSQSDLRVYLQWCAERGLDPLSATHPHIELFIRWMQEQRGYAASTVSRRVAVVAGFYRTCVIDGVLEHSPAEYVRRPNVPPQSPTLGLSHLQFEAMLAAARDSANRYDFALVCLLGLLGLRPTAVRTVHTSAWTLTVMAAPRFMRAVVKARLYRVGGLALRSWSIAPAAPA
jgi:site-specific recombinase XerD